MCFATNNVLYMCNCNDALLKNGRSLAWYTYESELGWSNDETSFVLWSTFSRILLQIIKHFWLRYLHRIWSKFGRVYDVINWLICISKKLEYLWNKKRYLKIANSILLLIQTTFLVLKWLRSERCDFRHSTTLKRVCFNNFTAISFPS